jgi:formylglycine-generating enzyme required for sulfatase activity
MRAKKRPWGIHDMHGNAWEWVEDCWTVDAREIPPDGSAFRRPGRCELGVIRGGSWAAPYRKLRSAHREQFVAAKHEWNVGFRVALSLESP